MAHDTKADAAEQAIEAALASNLRETTRRVVDGVRKLAAARRD